MRMARLFCIKLVEVSHNPMDGSCIVLIYKYSLLCYNYLLILLGILVWVWANKSSLDTTCHLLGKWTAADAPNFPPPCPTCCCWFLKTDTPQYRVLPTIFSTRPISTKLGFLGPPSSPLSVYPIADSPTPFSQMPWSNFCQSNRQETRLAWQNHHPNKAIQRPLGIMILMWSTSRSKLTAVEYHMHSHQRKIADTHWKHEYTFSPNFLGQYLVLLLVFGGQWLLPQQKWGCIRRGRLVGLKRLS